MTTGSSPDAPTASPQAQDPPPNGVRLRTWHLLGALMVLTLGIVGAIGLLAMTGADGMVKNLAVSVEDVDVEFLDSKKKPIDLDASALLNLASTAKKMQRGFVKVTLQLEIINRNPVDIEVNRVDYRVDVNGVEARGGSLPDKGERPILLRKSVVHERPLAVHLKTKQVLKGGSAQILKGARFVIRVTGTAEASVFGLPVQRPFKVKKIHEYGGLRGGSIPLPFP